MHALCQILPLVPAVETQQCEFPDGPVLSFVGPSRTVAKALELFMVSELLCFSQFLKFGISHKGSVLHVVVYLEPPFGVLCAQETQKICMDGFGYAHLIASLGQGVNIALFDHGFVPNLENGKAFGSFMAAVFKQGRARGTSDHTLKLHGTSLIGRVLVASQYGRRNPLQTISQKIEHDCVYHVGDNHVLVATSESTQQVHYLSLRDLIEAIETDGAPVWKHTPT